MYRFGFNNELVVHEDIDNFGTTSFTLDQGVNLVGLAVVISATYFMNSLIWGVCKYVILGTATNDTMYYFVNNCICRQCIGWGKNIY